MPSYKTGKCDQKTNSCATAEVSHGAQICFVTPTSFMNNSFVSQ